MIIDGAQGSPLIMASTEGGQEIEVVAHTNPERHRPGGRESGVGLPAIRRT